MHARQIDAREPCQACAATRNRRARLVEQADTERGEQARAAIDRRAATDAQNHCLDTSVQCLAEQFARAPAADQ